MATITTITRIRWKWLRHKRATMLALCSLAVAQDLVSRPANQNAIFRAVDLWRAAHKSEDHPLRKTHYKKTTSKWVPSCSRENRKVLRRFLHFFHVLSVTFYVHKGRGGMEAYFNAVLTVVSVRTPHNTKLRSGFLFNSVSGGSKGRDVRPPPWALMHK